MNERYFKHRCANLTISRRRRRDQQGAATRNTRRLMRILHCNPATFFLHSSNRNFHVIAHGLFETGTRGTPFPISGGSNRLEFPTFFSVFQFLSDARRAFYFSKRCIKGCTFREVHRRWNKRFRLSIGSLLSFREEYTRSIVRAADR